VPTGVTVLEQSRVSRLLEVDAVCGCRDNIDMGDVEYQSARRRAVDPALAIVIGMRPL